VLLDISMPGMSGEEVLAGSGPTQVQWPPHHRLYCPCASRRKAEPVEAGFDDLLIKPINLKAVERAGRLPQVLRAARVCG
jgi:CheY-like chemotaxis protein